MVKRSGNEQNTAKGESQFDREKHYVLENIKTGKIASSNNWLNTLAAIAVLEDNSSGIMAALPLNEARRLLQHNKVVEKNKRSTKSNSARGNTREQAKKMMPYLAVSYQKTLPSDSPPRVNEFCKWVVLELQDRQSEANKDAVSKGFHDLIDANRTKRWWQDQVKKMQS
jgi:hypothetical protein